MVVGSGGRVGGDPLDDRIFFFAKNDFASGAKYAGGAALRDSSTVLAFIALEVGDVNYVVQVIAACVLFISLVTLVGILVAHMPTQTWGLDTAMSLPSTTNFILLSSALLLLTHKRRS